jgi:hypothetical protein
MGKTQASKASHQAAFLKRQADLSSLSTVNAFLTPLLLPLHPKKSPPKIIHCSGASMTAERNPIRREAARVRCSGVSVSAKIVVTPQSQTYLWRSASDRYLFADRLCCVGFCSNHLRLETAICSAALAISKIFPPFFYCPNRECWKTMNMRSFNSVSLHSDFLCSPNVGRNTHSFFISTPN